MGLECCSSVSVWGRKSKGCKWKGQLLLHFCEVLVTFFRGDTLKHCLGILVQCKVFISTKHTELKGLKFVSVLQEMYALFFFLAQNSVINPSAVTFHSFSSVRSIISCMLGSLGCD